MPTFTLREIPGTVRARGGWARDVLLCLAIGGALLLPVGAAAQSSRLIWESEYGNGAPATPVTIGGTLVSITGLDPVGIGSPGNFAVSYATRGAHRGFWQAGVDATARGQLVTMRLTFGQPVENLTFSLLDVDGNGFFHDSITVVGWNGTAPFAPTTTGLGFAVSEVGPGSYSGLVNVDDNSTGGNVDLRFDQLVDSVTFIYGPGPRTLPDPALQIMGISDLAWRLPCIPTQTVTTTAGLRAAVADPCVRLVLMTPGTYDLTAGGSGELSIDQDKTLRNIGGGEVVIDAGRASRVLDIGNNITVELDGLTVSGGLDRDGGGIRTGADVLTIRNSTLTANESTRNGGGLYMRGGSLVMENVTVSGNTARRDGGGLDLRRDATLLHVTIAENSANRGGGVNSRDRRVEIVNSMVADNAAGQNPQIRNQISSLGINLVEGGCTGCRSVDLTGDPQLLPLGSNGGNSRTHAFAVSSIARDAADGALGLPTDQRGVARPQGAGYDIGAWEATLPVTVTVVASVASVNRLPSNGTTYSERFTVTNTGAASSAYRLDASATGAAVVVDSIRGAGLTWGAPPAEAFTAALAGGGGTAVVDVFYTVIDAAAGTTDALTLQATSTSVPSAVDSASTTVAVSRPFLGMTKSASVAGDTVPGAPITYQMTVTNLGTREAVDVVVRDSLPAELDFLVGSASQTLPSGVGVALAFDDGTDSWSYSPTPGGCGGVGLYDRCVRAVRWTLSAPLPAIAPGNAAVFTFIAAIR